MAGTVENDNSGVRSSNRVNGDSVRRHGDRTGSANGGRDGTGGQRRGPASRMNGATEAAIHRTNQTDEARGELGFASNTSGLNVRALISTKEAGSIIGRGGSNIAAIREATGVKAGVSKLVEGVGERVLEIRSNEANTQEIAKAFGMIVQVLAESSPSAGPGGTSAVGLQSPDSSNPGDGTGRHLPKERMSIRLLVSHTVMGSIIGRGGSKIKQIQDETGVRLVAHKELLPQSTERIVEVSSSAGDANAIQGAVLHIAQALLEDSQAGGGAGTVFYQPGNKLLSGNTGDLTDGLSSTKRFSARRNFEREGSDAVMHDAPYAALKGHSGPSVPDTSNDADARTQSIPLPADMVGCIIGKGGAKINEVRRLSGSRISIAKEPHDETGERLFTITGNAQSIEKALVLIYSQLEEEKARRSE